MPKLYDTVLDSLYKCIREKKPIVYGWGKVKRGYGLKPTEFDNFHGCSRSIFYKTRSKLLCQKLIDVIRTDKTSRTGHKPRYTITLLGIIKLFQTKPMSTDDFTEIMMILLRYAYFPSDELNTLSFWFRYTKQKLSKNFAHIYEQMFGKIDKQYLTKALTEVISSIKVEEFQKNIVVYLSYDFGNNNVLTFHKFISDGNNGILISYVYEEWRKEENNIDEFLTLCADFIIGKLWFKLSTQYEKYLPELMQKSIYSNPSSVIKNIRELTLDETYSIASNLIQETG